MTRATYGSGVSPGSFDWGEASPQTCNGRPLIAEHDIFFGWEIAKESASRNARSDRDLLDGPGAVALRLDQIEGSIDNL